METENKITQTPARRRGRPNATPAGRDQLAELNHVRAWWHEHQQDLPPLARLARQAGVKEDYARQLMKNLVPATNTLDKLYVVLEKFGYQPVVGAAQAVAPTTGGATFDWFNPLAAQQQQA